MTQMNLFDVVEPAPVSLRLLEISGCDASSLALLSRGSVVERRATFRPDQSDMQALSMRRKSEAL